MTRRNPPFHAWDLSTWSDADLKMLTRRRYASGREQEVQQAAKAELAKRARRKPRRSARGRKNPWGRGNPTPKQLRVEYRRIFGPDWWRDPAIKRAYKAGEIPMPYVGPKFGRGKSKRAAYRK